MCWHVVPLFNLRVDNFSGVLLCVFMKCRHFPTFFCAGTKKKKICRCRRHALFCRILPILSAVGDISATCRQHSQLRRLQPGREQRNAGACEVLPRDLQLLPKILGHPLAGIPPRHSKTQLCFFMCEPSSCSSPLQTKSHCSRLNIAISSSYN